MKASEFESHIVTHIDLDLVPIGALKAYLESSEDGTPTAIACHPKYGWAVIWTAGQSPGFAWLEKKANPKSFFNLAFTKEELLAGPINKGCTRLKRGQVWCFRCGRTEEVVPIKCLDSGWPECCGETMSIDSPEERVDHDKTTYYEMALTALNHHPDILDHMDISEDETNRLARVLGIFMKGEKS